MKKRLSRLKGRHISASLGHQGHSIELRHKKSSPPKRIAEVVSHSEIAPYDENLLERARTQWQFGDWPSLVQLDRNALQHHPDRAKLALLAAAGRLQTGQDAEARRYIRLARDWGVSKKLLTRMLAAGVHSILGRAAAIAGEQPRAVQHFQASIMTGTPGSEAHLLVQASVSHQYQQLDLPPVATGSLANSVPPAPTFLTRN